MNENDLWEYVYFILVIGIWIFVFGNIVVLLFFMFVNCKKINCFDIVC